MEFKHLFDLADAFHKSFEKSVKDYLYLQSQGAFNMARMANSIDDRTVRYTRPSTTHNDYIGGGASTGARTTYSSNGPITAPVFSHGGSYGQVHPQRFSGTRTGSSPNNQRSSAASVGTGHRSSASPQYNNSGTAKPVHNNDNNNASYMHSNVKFTPGVDRLASFLLIHLTCSFKSRVIYVDRLRI